MPFNHFYQINSGSVLNVKVLFETISLILCSHLQLLLLCRLQHLIRSFLVFFTGKVVNATLAGV